MLVAYPAAATAEFTTDGQGEPTGLVWRQQGAAPLSGTRVGFKADDVSFTNGDVTLAGTLIRPRTKGPHPLVVYVPPLDRAGVAGEMSRPVAEFFAAHGVAGLIYDKRGVGASTGDWLRRV